MLQAPRLSLPALLLVPAALAAQPPAPSPAPAGPVMAEVLKAAADSDWRVLDEAHTVYLDLPAGRVVIELAPLFAPRHVANVEALVREGYFDGLAVLRVQDNYVAQWGDPEDEDPKKARPVKTAKTALAAEFDVPWPPAAPFTPLPGPDGYAPEAGFAQGFPTGRDPAANRGWLAHCYGAVGVARGDDAGSGSGTSLYAVIGHAPRHLDRNVTVVGRVVQGLELLSSMPRGTGPLGFYEKPEQRLTIRRVRIAADLPRTERVALQVLRTDTETFARLVESRRNRREGWFKRPAGHVELCNVPVPVRQALPAGR